MDDGTSLWMRRNEVERTSKVTEKILTKPQSGLFVPGIRLGNISVGERRKADFPSHR